MFKAILIERNEGPYRARFTELDEANLPSEAVTVRVDYSSLNYKDALAITGAAPVVRHFPMIPGIDLAGCVQESDDSRYRPGDRVLLNGWGVGEQYFGGLAELARVKGDWLLRIPEPFTARDTMAIGTAGYTAMLCVMALEGHGIGPGSGDVLVSGAAGGVGSIAVALLARRGYRVVALTGRAHEAEFLRRLGAAEILDRGAYSAPGKPLAKERWAAAIDVAGGHTLANICASLRYAGVVAACGLAGGLEFPSTVAPFILRAVTLAGVDSVMCPREKRMQAWQRLAAELDPATLGELSEEIGLSEAIGLASELLAGKVRGRLIVDTRR